MKNEWDKSNDPVEQELERREMMRRVHGRAPLGRFFAPLLYWGAALLIGTLVARYIF